MTHVKLKALVTNLLNLNGFSTLNKFLGIQNQNFVLFLNYFLKFNICYPVSYSQNIFLKEFKDRVSTFYSDPQACVYRIIFFVPKNSFVANHFCIYRYFLMHSFENSVEINLLNNIQVLNIKILKYKNQNPENDQKTSSNMSTKNTLLTQSI